MLCMTWWEYDDKWAWKTSQIFEIVNISDK